MVGLSSPVVARHKERTRAPRFSQARSHQAQSSTVGNPGCPQRGSVGERKRNIHVAQDYAGMLEVTAVNDRSTDRLGVILYALVTQHPGKLRVLHVKLLPVG
jgi:hypothetical protein